MTADFKFVRGSAKFPASTLYQLDANRSMQFETYGTATTDEERKISKFTYRTNDVWNVEERQNIDTIMGKIPPGVLVIFVIHGFAGDSKLIMREVFDWEQYYNKPFTKADYAKDVYLVGVDWDIWVTNSSHHLDLTRVTTQISPGLHPIDDSVDRARCVGEYLADLIENRFLEETDAKKKTTTYALVTHSMGSHVALKIIKRATRIGEGLHIENALTKALNAIKSAKEAQEKADVATKLAETKTRLATASRTDKALASTQAADAHAHAVKIEQIAREAATGAWFALKAEGKSINVEFNLMFNPHVGKEEVVQADFTKTRSVIVIQESDRVLTSWFVPGPALGAYVEKGPDFKGKVLCAPGCQVIIIRHPEPDFESWLPMLTETYHSSYTNLTLKGIVYHLLRSQNDAEQEAMTSGHSKSFDLIQSRFFDIDKQTRFAQETSPWKSHKPTLKSLDDRSWGEYLTRAESKADALRRFVVATKAHWDNPTVAAVPEFEIGNADLKISGFRHDGDGPVPVAEAHALAYEQNYQQ